jgi:hypothetical protein
MKNLSLEEVLEVEQIFNEAEEGPELIVEEELTYEECMELIAAMDRFEEQARARLDERVKIYTSDEYSQEFLHSLLQKKG